MFESGCAALPDNDLARDCEQPWPYWRYTRLIAEQMFGGWQQGWDRIALSNIVKVHDGRRDFEETGAPDEATSDGRPLCPETRCHWPRNSSN